MDHKERFFATVAREHVDRPASWLGLPVDSALPALFRYFGVADVDALKRKLNDDIYPVQVPYNNPPSNDVGCALNFAKKGASGKQDERTLTAPGFFEDMIDPDQVKSYDWPDPEDYLDAVLIGNDFGSQVGLIVDPSAAE